MVKMGGKLNMKFYNFAVNGIKNFLGIKSPSKECALAGERCMEWFKESMILKGGNSKHEKDRV